MLHYCRECSLSDARNAASSASSGRYRFTALVVDRVVTGINDEVFVADSHIGEVHIQF